MGLWQFGVMDQVPLAAAQDVKVVTDIDGHSLLLMRAKVVAAATALSSGSPHRGRACRSVGMVADPGVVPRAALAILSHTLAGSLGDRMRTPALLGHAPRQLIGPSFISRINPSRHRPRIADSRRQTSSVTARIAGLAFDDG
jgi:hypothetical protein